MAIQGPAEQQGCAAHVTSDVNDGRSWGQAEVWPGPTLHLLLWQWPEASHLCALKSPA
jgi:hypothetical protein